MDSVVVHGIPSYKSSSFTRENIEDFCVISEQEIYFVTNKGEIEDVKGNFSRLESSRIYSAQRTGFSFLEYYRLERVYCCEWIQFIDRQIYCLRCD